MDLIPLLIRVLEITDGWVIVVVFLLYVIWQMYKKYKESAALSKSLTILESTISGMIKNIDASVKELAAEVRKLKE